MNQAPVSKFARRDARWGRLRGNWATLLLPIGADDAIDFARLTDTLDAITAARVDGIYSNGTAGECHNQTEGEFDAIQGLLAERCRAAGTPFVIGACQPDPRLALDRVRRAAALRPDGIQVILPDWAPVTPPEATDFLHMAAEAAGDVPLVLYNPPHANGPSRPRRSPRSWRRSRRSSASSSATATPPGTPRRAQRSPTGRSTSPATISPPASPKASRREASRTSPASAPPALRLDGPDGARPRRRARRRTPHPRLPRHPHRALRPRRRLFERRPRQAPRRHRRLGAGRHPPAPPVPLHRPGRGRPPPPDRPSGDPRDHRGPP